MDMQELQDDFNEKNFYYFDRKCPVCGARLVAFKDEDGKPRSRYGACPDGHYAEEGATNEQETLRLTEESHKNDAFSFMRKVSIFPDASVFNHKLSNFNAKTRSLESIIKQAHEISERIANGEIVHAVLTGNTGTGKTHTAMGMLYQILELTKYRYKVAFVDFRELLARRKQAIGDKDMTAQLNRTMQRIKKADVVVIDDFGSENAQGGNNTQATQYNTELANELLSARENKNTIITTNVIGADLRKMYGERSTSRIGAHSKGNNILFDGITDYRLN